MAACTYFSFINLISLGVRCEYIFIALLEGTRMSGMLRMDFRVLLVTSRRKALFLLH